MVPLHKKLAAKSSVVTRPPMIARGPSPTSTQTLPTAPSFSLAPIALPEDIPRNNNLPDMEVMETPMRKPPRPYIERGSRASFETAEADNSGDESGSEMVKNRLINKGEKSPTAGIVPGQQAGNTRRE